MNVDEWRIRREFTRAAQQVDVPPTLADQIIESSRAGDTRRRAAGPIVRRWSGPLLAAGVAALLIAAVAVGQGLLHSGHTTTPTSPATQNTLAGPVGTSPVPTGTPTASAPASSASSAPSGTPVPSGFTVQDLTFVSTDEGWALGTNGRLAHTTDGGQHWTALPATPWAGDSSAAIQNVRFATQKVGYAYSPSALFLTTDGGTTWSRQSDGAWGLEVADGVAVRVVGQGLCAPGCTYRIERAPVGSSTWQQIALPDGQFRAGAQLARTGKVLALATLGHWAGGASNAFGALFVSNDDGATWTTRAVCPSPSGPGEVDLHGVSMGPDGTMVVLCQARMAGGPASLQLSTDGGASFRSLPQSLGSAPVSLVGAASQSVLFVQSDVLYRSTDGGASWRRVQSGGSGPLTASYLGFQTGSIGRVAETAPGQTGARTIWTTRDAGQSWVSYTFG